MYVLNGYGERPDWYRNLLADPRATLQSAAGVEQMRARRVTDDAEFEAAYACFARSAALRVVARLIGVPLTRETFRAGRSQFILLAFDPTAEPTPPPLPTDLAWVWLVPAALLLALLGRRQGSGASAG